MQQVSGYPQTLIYLPILDDGDEVDRQSVQLREVFDKENDIICTLESCMEFELKMNTCWKSVKEIRVCPSSDSTANTSKLCVHGDYLNSFIILCLF